MIYILYNMNTEEIIQEIVEIKNLSKGRKRTYQIVLKQYEQCHGMTIQELINEAEEDEDNAIPLRRRRIKQRILKYRQSQQEQNLQHSSINTKIQLIKALYNYYELQLPRIPQIKITQTEQITDIPTKKHIQQALNNTTNPCHKAIITLQASSGCARTELLNLTIQDFIQATKEYHHSQDIRQVLQELQYQHKIIPTFHIHRQKTNIQYYTFCSPEATQYIIQYLQQRQFKEELTPNTPLFHLKRGSYIAMYRHINDKNRFGRLKTRIFFHSHAMRKYFATTLLKNQVDSLSVHFLLGHHIDDVTDAYMKADPRALKLTYMNVVHELSFMEEISYKEISSDERLELEQLRREHNTQRAEIQQLLSDVAKLKQENNL